MITLPHWTEQVIPRLAWVLIHFIWQGALVALLLALTIWIGRVRRPTHRYTLSLIALLAMLACPVMTFVSSSPAATAILPTQASSASPLAGPESPGEEGVPTSLSRVDIPASKRVSFGGTAGPENLDPAPLTIEPALTPALPLQNEIRTVSSTTVRSVRINATLLRQIQRWIVNGWLFGVALLSLKLLLGWIGVWRLRKQVHSAPNWLVERTRILANSLRIRAPGIELSQRVTDAIAIGFLKPMILIPVAWVTELPPDMLDAIIAHELSHIRRGDLWINLLQRLAEILLFYHPAIWWLSRRLRIERELCCDELVVNLTQNRLRYAETLERVGRLSLPGTKSTLTVSIAGTRSVLLDRIRQVLNLEPRGPGFNAWLAGIIPLLIAGLIWSTASTTRNDAVHAEEASVLQPRNDEEEKDERAQQDLKKKNETVANEAAPKPAAQPVPLDRIVSLKAKRTPIENALQQVCDAAQVPLHVDGDALKSEGYTRNMPVTLELQNVTLRDALTRITQNYEKIVFAEENGLILVSTEKVLGNKKVRGTKKVAGPQKVEKNLGPTGSLLLAGPFQGVVRSTTRQPIPHADVVLCRQRLIDGRKVMDVVATGKADQHGNYWLNLTDPVRKEWQMTTRGMVWAMADGFAPGVVRYALGDQMLEFPLPETQVDPDDEPVRLLYGALYPERTVDLEVTDDQGRPIEGRVLSFELEHGEVPPTFVSRMFPKSFIGKLTIQHMPSGHHEGSPIIRVLRIETQSHGLVEFTWNADSSSEQAGRVREGVQPIKLTVQSPARVTGRLVSQQGELPPELIRNVRIRLETFQGDSSLKTPWSGGFAEATTDAEGRYTFPHVACGKVRKIRVDLAPKAHWQAQLTNREEIVLTPDKTTEIDIPLVATRTLRGFVRRPNGTGLPNVGFNISYNGMTAQSDSDKPITTPTYYRESILTDAEGKFAIEVLPGDLSITKQFSAGSDIGTPNLWPAAEHKIPEWQPGNRLRIAAGKEPFDLPPIDVTIYRGVLLDETGQPVEGILAAFDNKKSTLLGLLETTKPDGSFVMEVLGKAASWSAGHRSVLGFLGLPEENAYDVVVNSEFPLVLQMKPKLKAKQPEPKPEPEPEPDSGKEELEAPPKPAAQRPAEKNEIEFSAFEWTLDNRAFDIARMTLVQTNATVSSESLLHVDRLWQALGCGDLAWSASTRQLIGLRGARLMRMGDGDLHDVNGISHKLLREDLLREGKGTLKLENDLGGAAIESHEGHLILLKIVKVNKTSLTVKAYRLTTEENMRLEKIPDGLEHAVWGPVNDGLQAGIVFRESAARPQPSTFSIGDLVQVKLFVRNVNTRPQSFSWRREKTDRKIPVSIPLLDVWQPLLVSADGQRAITGRSKIYDPGDQLTSNLQPGEAVFVGAASLALWPAIQPGFGVYPNRQVSAAVEPGQYRLSTEIPTGLVNGPQLHTGELRFEVTAPAQKHLDSLSQLDAIGHLTGSEEDDDWTSWRDAKTSRRIRPAFPVDAIELQTIPCRVFDSTTNKPVSGATARIEIAAWGDQSFDSLCEYELVTDAAGRFEMQIPRALLTGYLPEKRPDFRVFVTHPQYSEVFDSKVLNDLQGIGIVSKDGTVLKPAAAPELGVPLDTSKFASFQAIALKPARTLSGRLLGADQKPLANIPIYGSNVQGWPALPGLPRTDNEGRFRFNVPTQMTMNLEFRAANLGRIYFKATPDRTDLGDIQHVPGVKVHGQVLGAGGRPVAHIAVTTPSWPDRISSPNFNYYTDEKGWFETDLLAPGEYQVEVGGISLPADRNTVSISSPPPDLYRPVRFAVRAGGSVSEFTIRPAVSTRLTATLITTVPRPANGEIAQSIDPLYWRVIQEKERLKQEERGLPVRPGVKSTGQQLEFRVAPETGTVAIDGIQSQQQKVAFQWLSNFARVPFVTVHGKWGDQEWTRIPHILELSDAEPPTYTAKLPQELTETTLEMGDYIQHVQIGSGSKLFGKSIVIKAPVGDQLDVNLYRYRPTTLKLIFVDAAGKPIAMRGNKLPEGISVKAHYRREAEVRQAGARFGSSEEFMSRSILENAVLHFVLPGEEIELTVARIGGEPSKRPLTLKDGETRTIQVQLDNTQNWTETSEPTPRVKDWQD